MRNRKADDANWQARGQEFAVGMAVRLVNGGDTDEGRVIAVWPAIGMVDVQFPHTNYRFPVEDLHIINPAEDPFVAPLNETVPGGEGSSAMFSMGQPQKEDHIKREEPRVEQVKIVGIDNANAKTASMIARVAQAHFKKALYWNGRDRKYRCTKVEGATEAFTCPKSGCSGVLKPAVYKRVDGESVKLMGCPSCMFLIRRKDILENACDDEIEEAV
jgi:hypothetical protein